MGATTILVIVLAVLFFGGMAGLLIYLNTAPKDGSDQAPKRKQ
jgi:hypothetical protein